MVITSAGPAEGKTVVASNVAIGLGQLGQRVLLIDGDMRRPKVHEFFDMEAEPGLSNLLIGEKKASEVVIQSQVPNVWVLAAGHRPPNPCDLLGSDRFKAFLASVKEHFDWILIDAPPVLAVTDACVAGHAASGVLFVVGAERVTRPEARRAIDHLMAAQARFAGVVLSRVELERHAYYYSRYYSRKYTDYYAHPSPVRSSASLG
jgi:capsular exopolysaccharide synthesis family protein